MQLSILCAQFVPGLKLVDSYRDAKSVPYGNLLIDFLPRTDDRLRFCTNTWTISSKFYIKDWTKKSKILDDDHTKSLYTPSDPIIFPQMQKSFPSVLSKRLYQVLVRMYSKSVQRKTAKPKKTSRYKTSKRCSLALSTENLRKLKKRNSGIWKRVTTQKKSILLWLSTICLDMEQFLLVPASVYNKSLNTQSVRKPKLPNYQPSQNSTYQINSSKTEKNKRLFAKADSLVDKNLSCRINKLSSSHTLELDGVENGVLLSHFVQQLRHKNADVPAIYFTLLDSAVISPTPVRNQIAKGKKRGSWVAFKKWTSDAAKIVHAEWCCLWLCAQFSEN